MTENIDDYIVERGEGMVRCRCGLAVANDKMQKHLESEHFVKVFSDIFSGKNKQWKDYEPNKK